MKRFLALTSASLLLVAGVACSQVADTLDVVNPLSEVKPVEAKVVTPGSSRVDKTDRIAFGTHSNGVGLDYMRMQLDSEPDANLILSPLNLSIAMNILADATGGSSQDQVLALAAPDYFKSKQRQDFVTSYIHELETSGERRENESIDIASSLWVKENFNIRQTYVDLFAQRYKGTAYEVDMLDPKTAAAMQAWIKDNTGGMIESDYEPSPETVTTLMTALFFKGTWSKEFAPEQTEAQDFYLENGQAVQTDMMHKTLTARYYEHPDFQWVQLYYGNGSFVLLVPTHGTVSDLLKDLDQKTLQTAMAEASSYDVELTLPKFKHKSKLTLQEMMETLGVTDVFQLKNADFSGLSEEPNLVLSNVLHDAAIDLHEEGTTAAAVTIMEVETTSMPMEMPKVVVTADKPFIYFIYDPWGSQMMFSGVYVKPE